MLGRRKRPDPAGLPDNGGEPAGGRMPGKIYPAMPAEREEGVWR